MSVGNITGTTVGVSTGTGVSVAVAAGSTVISGVGDSTGASVADGAPVEVAVGRGVGEKNGRGVTVGITGSGVKVAKGVVVAKGVKVLVGVEVGEGVPGVLVMVGVLVGKGVGVDEGIGVRDGLGAVVRSGVPGPTVSFSSGRSSSNPGGSVPSGVGVGRLRRGPSSLTERLHALSRHVARRRTGPTHNGIMTRRLVRPLEVRKFHICPTITHAQPVFNFPAGRAASRMVTWSEPLNDRRLHALTLASRRGTAPEGSHSRPFLRLAHYLPVHDLAYGQLH